MIEIKNLSGEVIFTYEGSNLRYANLRGSNLRGSNLRYADLRYSNLIYADLEGSNLRDSNLRDSNLRYADLRYADLRNSNLRYADLRNSNLRGANIEGANLPNYTICPEEGDFIAWKKSSEGNIIKLLIPKEAKRTSSLVGRKCRAEFALVLEGCGTGKNGLEYKEGEKVFPDKYDDDIRIECTNGIQFFITKKEAEEY